MAHKLAHYVAYLQDDVQTPDQVEVALQVMVEQVNLFVVALEPYLPEPEPDWDLDRWWAEVVRLHREGIKQDLIDTYGSLCECCEVRVGYDMHEVFKPRWTDTSWRQIFLFSLSNCVLVCPECHQSGAVYAEEFKEKVRVRRELLTNGDEKGFDREN
jgi:hypothetical protein